MLLSETGSSYGGTSTKTSRTSQKTATITSIQEYPYKIKSLKMENKLLRDFAIYRQDGRTQIKYEVIFRHRDCKAFSMICHFFEVSRNGYYDFHWGLLIWKNEWEYVVLYLRNSAKKFKKCHRFYLNVIAFKMHNL